MKEKINIRKAKKSELERCQRIVHDCINYVKVSKRLKKILYEDYSFENVVKYWEETGIYVSEKHGFIRGTGRLEKTGEIRMIYVDPDFHRLGFGSNMIEKMENLAKRRGYKKVYVHALPPARGFYKKLGFKLRGFRKNGTYKMIKRLG